MSKNGLASRACTALVSQANKFKCDLQLIYQDENANLKSIMNMMALVIKHGEKFSISANGKQEEEAIQSLENLLINSGLI